MIAKTLNSSCMYLGKERQIMGMMRTACIIDEEDVGKVHHTQLPDKYQLIFIFFLCVTITISFIFVVNA